MTLETIGHRRIGPTMRTALFAVLLFGTRCLAADVPTNKKICLAAAEVEALRVELDEVDYQGPAVKHWTGRSCFNLNEETARFLVQDLDGSTFESWSLDRQKSGNQSQVFFSGFSADFDVNSNRGTYQSLNVLFRDDGTTVVSLLLIMRSKKLAITTSFIIDADGSISPGVRNAQPPLKRPARAVSSGQRSL
jgi:hypothetical protein